MLYTCSSVHISASFPLIIIRSSQNWNVNVSLVSKNVFFSVFIITLVAYKPNLSAFNLNSLKDYQHWFNQRPSHSRDINSFTSHGRWFWLWMKENWFLWFLLTRLLFLVDRNCGDFWTCAFGQGNSRGSGSSVWIFRHIKNDVKKFCDLRSLRGKFDLNILLKILVFGLKNFTMNKMRKAIWSCWFLWKKAVVQTT